MPTHNDQSLELAALQCIFMGPEGNILLKSLLPEDFVKDEYRETFRALIELSAAGKSADFPSVCSALHSVPWWEKSGGSGWLAQHLAVDVPYWPTPSFAPALRNLTILRMQEELRLSQGDVESNIADLEKARDTYLGLLPSTAKTVPELKTRMEEKPVEGIPTGFPAVDGLVGGMEPGQFVVVGARTGVGKSVFLMNVGVHVAMHTGKKVLWIGLEMTENEMLKRFCKTLGGENKKDALDYLENMHMISGAKTISQVESEVMRGTYDLIILDYLQLCRTGNRYDNDVQELQELTRRCKLLAMKKKTILLAAAQLNRDVEQNNRYPRLSDLRGSGSIEQDADIVILLHRLMREEDLQEKNSSRMKVNAAASFFQGQGDTTVFVEKNRKGKTGTVYMKFDPNFLKFV